MALHLSKESTKEEVILFLKENNFEESVIDAFEKNEVDGEDFFDLDFCTINSLLPTLKIRKKFISAWTKETNMTFDVHGTCVPCDSRTTTKVTDTVIECVDKGREKILDVRSSSPRKRSSGNALESPGGSSPKSPRRMSPRKNAKNVPSSKPKGRHSPVKTTPNAQRKNTVSEVKKSPLEKQDSMPSARRSPKGHKTWLENFTIPNRWEPDVERGLSKGHLSPEQQNSLVRQLCTTIMAHTKELRFSEREHIALLLVREYPFLKGSFGPGHQIWSKKIMNRIHNIKKKATKGAKKLLYQSDDDAVVEVKCGRKKAQSPTSTIPAIPDGETDDTLHEQKKELKELCSRGSPDLRKVRHLMDTTFPIRRKSIITENKRVWELVKDYPPLEFNTGSEIRSELERILKISDCTKAMKEAFRETWKPRLLSLLKNSDNKPILHIINMLEDDEGEIVDVKEMENRCIIAALPYLLGEKKSLKHNPGDTFWKFVPENAECDVAKEVEATTAPRLISSGGAVDDITSINLAAEGMILCKFKKVNILTAMVTLLASFYALNAAYPKGPGGQSKNVFLFLEYILIPQTRKSQATTKLPIAVETVVSQLNRLP